MKQRVYYSALAGVRQPAPFVAR